MPDTLNTTISSPVQSSSESVEVDLAAAIAALWSAHRETKASAKRTREELRTVRHDLASRLHQMKNLLVQTGRGGGWASYLRDHRIPRATADRYVRQHEEILTPSLEKRLTEAISGPPEEEVHLFFQKLLPRLLKALPTQEAAFLFVCEMVCGLPSVGGDVTDEGALIFRPAEPGSCEASAETQSRWCP